MTEARYFFMPIPEGGNLLVAEILGGFLQGNGCWLPYNGNFPAGLLAESRHQG